MTATVLPFQVLEAPENWRTVDFISDLHLQENDTATFDVWQKYMQTTTADAVFILGDLFEVWVGDDAAQHHVFLQKCATVLKSCSTLRHVAFMRGNRDFLVGTTFLNACHVQDLQDPTLVNFATQRSCSRMAMQGVWPTLAIKNLDTWCANLLGKQHSWPSLWKSANALPGNFDHKVKCSSKILMPSMQM